MLLENKANNIRQVSKMFETKAKETYTSKEGFLSHEIWGAIKATQIPWQEVKQQQNLVAKVGIKIVKTK